ncbi:Protein kinase-like domain protein [Cordyceps fumosorosea ARSEF 2679]|uniref:Protein kinase-like domain protein n=1 Tax=Cordyceps fumosorosea (strain ARSEF 2679) TaxID=1081104 RepID=A0A162N128_CORFA|nr:Protein kinase-like domain protein [Cordyceps fumosorosea ARSEF 2679]OAA73799.1 Protein kinase-like domain protein [Cordyceps fumosorosea ARSEF 2679]
MSRPQTPPHEPRYHVHVAQKTIEQLISSAFPGTGLISCSELETNKGYNNRLYFLKVRRLGQSSVFRNTDAEKLDLVLKVNGYFFKADKVQNEVGCIQILKKYCPDIPAPTVLAWSEDGVHVCLSNPSGPETKHVSLSIPDEDKRHGGWILMLRIPGKPLSTCDFHEATRLDIMRQLAGIVASWRANIPAQKYIGNIQFHQLLHDSEPDFTITENSGPGPQDLVVRGILVDELWLTTPITSTVQQYTLKIEQKLEQLDTSSDYAQNRHLAAQIRSFVTNTLPQLDALNPPPPQHSSSGGHFVFTHYDLSPRNILVTATAGSPPRISGIVDFEFAGFFPPVEEFLNDAVGNAGDWPEELYGAYLAGLEARGIATPAKGIDAEVWEAARCLEHVADNVAPWWLPGPHTGAVLEEKFARSAAELQENLKKLSNGSRGIRH